MPAIIAALAVTGWAFLGFPEVHAGAHALARALGL